MLTLIRGLPGSGKSTYAKTLGCLHLEADMYFMCNGVYVFDSSKIKAAHSWCQQATLSALSSGMDVVVSNTFVKAWEIKWYVDCAGDQNHKVNVVTCDGNYTNTHGVPENVVERMRANWETF